jgi:hypothetical protein
MFVSGRCESAELKVKRSKMRKEERARMAEEAAGQGQFIR